MQITTDIRRLGRRLINELTQKGNTLIAKRNTCAPFLQITCLIVDVQKVITGYPLCTVAQRGHPNNFFDYTSRDKSKLSRDKLQLIT